jgi:hypothetical protein
MTLTGRAIAADRIVYTKKQGQVVACEDYCWGSALYVDWRLQTSSFHLPRIGFKVLDSNRSRDLNNSKSNCLQLLQADSKLLVRERKHIICIYNQYPSHAHPSI